MAYTHSGLEILFMLTVVVLWGMIFYQMLFTFFGYIYHQRSVREQNDLDQADAVGLPPVSVLIPAHNEALVIKETLQSIQALHYPAESLEVIVINDGSTDGTPDIVKRIGRQDPRVKLVDVPADKAARGKSNALNTGLKHVTHDFIAVYDADNTPEKKSLKYLMLNLVREKSLAAVFGKFRTRNRNRTLLTRFINLETLSFQFMIQAGRYLVLKIAILPGTNLVIRKKILEDAGEWDEGALTEDTELSIRLYEKGRVIKFVPYAVTWEEEPEKWGTWFKQRTRWVRGNFYVLRKYLFKSFRFRNHRLTFELVYLFLLYYLFLAAILISHIIFVISGLGLAAVLSPGPYFLVWICAFALFMAEVTLAASYEGELSFESLVITALMYLTYCQGWIILVFMAVYQDFTQREKVQWEKTRRFGSTSQREAP